MRLKFFGRSISSPNASRHPLQNPHLRTRGSIQASHGYSRAKPCWDVPYRSRRHHKAGQHLVLNGSERYGSPASCWVAFYPDIPHEVTRIESGYRAVIAFKIFRHDDAPETSLTGVSETVARTPEALTSNVVNVDMLVAVESVLAKLCAIGKPFAFHLTHLYNKSLIEPVGFDNILLLAATKQQPALVRLLPVLCERSYSYDYGEPQESEQCHFLRLSTHGRPHGLPLGG
jgi:hypothetical protein